MQNVELVLSNLRKSSNKQKFDRIVKYYFYTPCYSIMFFLNKVYVCYIFCFHSFSQHGFTVHAGVICLKMSVK